MTEERTFTLIGEDETLEEDKVEDVVKDNEFNLETIEEETSGTDELKERRLLSEDNVTGLFTEEAYRTISKIYDKTRGKEVEEDVSLVESLVGAGFSAGIKIPKGLVTFGTLLADIFRDQNIPVDETLTAKFNEAFDKTIVGKIE